MIVTWQVVALVLLAILVGAAIPALLQARRTLRRADVVLETLDRRLGRTLDEVDEALSHINRLGAEFENGASRFKNLFEVADGLGHSARRLRSSLNAMSAIGGAVAPALAAAARAFFHSEPRPARGARADGDDRRGGDGADREVPVPQSRKGAAE